MSGFLNNLVARHTGAENKVLPRLPGRFESYAGPFAGPDDSKPIGDTALRPGKEASALPVQEPLKVHAKPVPDLVNQVASPPPITPTAPTSMEPAEKQPSPVIHPLRIHEVHTESLIQKETVHHHETLQPPQVINQAIMPPAATDNFQPLTSIQLLNNPQPPTDIQPPIPIAIGTNIQLNDPSWLQQLRRTMRESWPAEQPKTEQQPVIKVTIGRVDVRAVTQAQGSTKTSSSHPKPAMSLEDFLKNKNGSPS